jgi:hypothetical protein
MEVRLITNPLAPKDSHSYALTSMLFHFTVAVFASDAHRLMLIDTRSGGRLAL